MAPAEEWFIGEGCGRLTMNMVLTGTDTYARPEFKIARSEEVLGGFVLPSLEVAGPGMHWVEVSRAVRAASSEPSDDTKRMMEAYTEYYDAAKVAMRAGATCHDVHTSPSRRASSDRGYHLGHVTGHSIGMTMIEFPKVGEGSEVELEENMVLSMHPHAIAADGEDCLYMQDTWLVTRGRRCAARRPRDGDLGRRAERTTKNQLLRPLATLRGGYTVIVSWPWIVLLAIGVGVLVAAEWPRFERLGRRGRPAPP